MNDDYDYSNISKIKTNSPSKQAVCTTIAGKKMYTYKTAYKNI